MCNFVNNLNLGGDLFVRVRMVRSAEEKRVFVPASDVPGLDWDDATADWV